MVNFITFDDNFITYYYLNLLSKYYTKKDFIKINRLFKEINNNIFLSIQNKNNIFLAYNQNMKLKYIVDNIIEAKKLKLTKCINKRFLDYNFTYKKNLGTIKIYANRTNYYKFINIELIKIFYNSLIHQEESIAEPNYPINPYTGIKFNYENLSKCYANFIICREYLPIELIMFKNCNFNIEKLIKSYKNYFNKLAIKNWLKSLNNNDWISIFNLFYKALSLKKYICYKCVIELSDYKSIFLNFVTEYFELINSFKSVNIDFIERLYTIIENLNIEPEYEHITKHKRIFKKKYTVFKNTTININFCNKQNYKFGSN